MKFEGSQKVSDVHNILNSYNDIVILKKNVSFLQNAKRKFNKMLKSYNTSDINKSLALKLIKYVYEDAEHIKNGIVFTNITKEFENNVIEDVEMVMTLRNWRGMHSISSDFLNCILEMYDMPIKFKV